RQGMPKIYEQDKNNDGFNAPDWYPQDHPPMPRIVANGSPPTVRACTQCHLTSGNGHPESSSVAGLPAVYIVRQMAAFKNGERKGIRTEKMIAFAKTITDEDLRASAAYFSSLKPTRWIPVVENHTAPVGPPRPGDLALWR